MGNLDGQVAVVTGAASGLGKAITEALAAEGAHVVIADILQKEGERLAQSLGGKGRFVYCDLIREADVVALADVVIKEFGKVDILVNNAGIGAVSPLWETSTEVWDKIMAVNVRGGFLCAKYFTPRMIERKSGRIINIASAVGRQAQPLLSAYAVSKASNIAMTVSLAKEVAEHGITVNAVCPGPVETDWWKEPKKVLSEVLKVSENSVLDFFKNNKQLIKVPIKPEDVGRVVCWLVSKDTALITGQAISIDGGHEFPTY